MLRVSLGFSILSIICLALADIAIITHEPWFELKRMAVGAVTPDFSHFFDFFLTALFNTISFALLGIVLALILGSILSFFFEWTPVRLFCSFLRSIHEIFWAFLIMPLTGLTGLCGILAIAIPYAGVFAKVYAEIRQETERPPREALPYSAGRLSVFFFAELPALYPQIATYTSYRFECALRSSAILGFIGLPTLGYHLETFFREGMYSEAAALLFCFYLLIISLRYWTKPRYILIPLIVALVYSDWAIALSLDNIIRFFTYDILPWPIKADGFYTGTRELSFELGSVWHWAVHLFQKEAIPGIWNTFILTQISLVGTAIFTLSTFFFGSRTFFSSGVSVLSQLGFILLRTTPEFILAYIFLQLWGPSMLPAILALLLHNGSIISHLMSRDLHKLPTPWILPKSRSNIFFFEILPRCYGQFLAFLFYRWEVIMRESAILGILGIATLGHFIDSAIARDHLDTALFLISITALLNMTIDSLSQIIRKRLHLSLQLEGCRY